MEQLKTGWYWVQLYNGAIWRPEYYSSLQSGFIIDGNIFRLRDVYNFEIDKIERKGITYV